MFEGGDWGEERWAEEVGGVEFCATEKKVFAKVRCVDSIIADNGKKKFAVAGVKPEPIRNSE